MYIYILHAGTFFFDQRLKMTQLYINQDVFLLRCNYCNQVIKVK
jgi:hypothetical protein